jgi:hypothetical protein
MDSVINKNKNKSSKYTTEEINKKKEELRRICFNKNNNEVLVQGRGPYSYSINIDEADDETIMKLQKIGS